ncbi:myb domain protein 53 [Striga asiatica]|uniref:Myb domain protein 53 n=1 Tax=Striga asiatica TaxID=4170 RepID=A0A5A7PP31_STRAF|nr:myb domain protein 53 [Striga asiatica]
MATVDYAAFLAIILIFQAYSVTANFTIPFLSPLIGTLNNDCANALPPASDNHKNANFSFLDPCFWTYCGGGSCNKTSIFTHSCECDEGYFNLFNSTSFPCYKECALGLDCASLGLNMNNSTTSRPGSRQSSAEDSNSPGLRLIPRVEFDLFIALCTTLALVVRKYG